MVIITFFDVGRTVLVEVDIDEAAFEFEIEVAPKLELAVGDMKRLLMVLIALELALLIL